MLNGLFGAFSADSGPVLTGCGERGMETPSLKLGFIELQLPINLGCVAVKLVEGTPSLLCQRQGPANSYCSISLVGIPPFGLREFRRHGKEALGNLIQVVGAPARQRNRDPFWVRAHPNGLPHVQRVPVTSFVSLKGGTKRTLDGQPSPVSRAFIALFFEERADDCIRRPFGTPLRCTNSADV
jgi:hypothetical protein